jgi:tripartite ATP-independent transporter DctP family solute receptor
MKRLVCYLLSLTLIGVFLAGPGNAARKKIVMKLSAVISDSDLKSNSTGMGLVKFKEEVEKRVGNKVEIKIYPGGQLGTKASEVLGGLQTGSIEIAQWSPGNYGEYSKAFVPLDIPYLFPDEKVAQRFLASKVGKKMKEQLIKDADIRMLGYFDCGFRHLTNNKREIKTPADLKGLKIRTMTNPMQMITFKQFGAAPTPIAFAELFTALQQGVVDGQENPLTQIYFSRFQEVQKYITLTAHSYTLSGVAMGNDYYNSLPKDVKKAINISINIAAKFVMEKRIEQENTILKELAKTIKVTKLSQAEKKQFRETAKKCWPELAAKIGKAQFREITNEVDKIDKALNN